MPILKLFLFFLWVVLMPVLVGLSWSVKEIPSPTEGRGHFHIFLAYFDGIFIILALFEILAIPMVFLKGSLKQLSTLWAILTLVLAAFSTRRGICLRQFRQPAASCSHRDAPGSPPASVTCSSTYTAAGTQNTVGTMRLSSKVKDPDASIRGIKLAAMQASGYLTLAAVAKYPRKRVYLARCFAGIKLHLSHLKSRVSPLFLAVWLCILLQVAYVTVNQHIDDDDAFYVATAVTATETDTLMEYNPYTGELYKNIPTRYVLASWPLYLAVLSTLCAGLHPTLIAHLLLPGLIVLFAYLIYALIARELFPDDSHRQDLFLLIVALVISFSGFSIYSSGVFLITRGWQGKALVAAVIQPALFYLCRQAMTRNTDWFLLFCTVTTACMFSSMGVVLSVIPVGVYALVYGISQKKWKIFPCALLACLGALVCGMIYLLL